MGIPFAPFHQGSEAPEYGSVAYLVERPTRETRVNFVKITKIIFQPPAPKEIKTPHQSGDVS